MAEIKLSQNMQYDPTTFSIHRWRSYKWITCVVGWPKSSSTSFKLTEHGGGFAWASVGKKGARPQKWGILYNSRPSLCCFCFLCCHRNCGHINIASAAAQPPPTVSWTSLLFPPSLDVQGAKLANLSTNPSGKEEEVVCINSGTELNANPTTHQRNAVYKRQIQCSTIPSNK